MQLQTTSPESKFSNEYIGVIFIQIDQHLKKLLKKYKGVPILWNMLYLCSRNTSSSTQKPETSYICNSAAKLYEKLHLNRT